MLEMAEETYYLIDFENVGLKGLEGAEKLTTHDHVHLFSTRNAPKITTAILANFNGTNLLVHEVPAKSQSVDMHLVSYLGYLLGSCKPVPKIVILSNDTDYDDIVQFWKTELNVAVKRRDKFGESKPAASAKAGTKASVAAKPSTKEKTAASAKTATKEKAAAPAKTATKEKAAAPAKAKAEKADETKSQKTGEAKTRKTAGSKAQKAVEPKDKTAVNNAVMKALSNAKFDNEIAAFAASQVTKLFSEKNGKQLIYRSIISKYGQEQGLKVYREIKKLL
jgi:hypothetical protein